MQLLVTLLYDAVEQDAGAQEITVESFRDVVRIGAVIARAVREWLRQVPMTPHVKQRNFHVSAEWVESKPARANPGPDLAPEKPQRKRKAKK